MGHWKAKKYSPNHKPILSQIWDIDKGCKMLKNIIEKAETKAGSQKELSAKFKINYRRLCDYKAGRRTPDDAIVIKMAQYIGIDPIQALFESKAEYDIDNADLWKWCARRESNPRPSASETDTLSN